ncbi:hypothetical protein B0H11DRAFT_1285308 [Mycena galericulata]|nr:hypothetical protein B0H11DRAFT_1285308 [Mycena galericulata]
MSTHRHLLFFTVVQHLTSAPADPPVIVHYYRGLRPLGCVGYVPLRFRQPGPPNITYFIWPSISSPTDDLRTTLRDRGCVMNVYLINLSDTLSSRTSRGHDGACSCYRALRSAERSTPPSPRATVMRDISVAQGLSGPLACAAAGSAIRLESTPEWERRECNGFSSGPYPSCACFSRKSRSFPRPSHRRIADRLHLPKPCAGRNAVRAR